MADFRLQRILEAASHLFINLGYSRTQISHIAKQAGISVGSVYALFTGKKAILCFVLKMTLEPGFMEHDLELPIGEDCFDGLHQEIKQAFDTNNRLFSAHLMEPPSEYPFSQMLSDAFDIVARYGTGCLLFEKNPKDCAGLIQGYVQYREKFFRTFLQYVELYVANGTVRTLEYPFHSVSLMIETIAWWAMHVRYDAFEAQRDLPEKVAKTVCLDALIHAYQV